MNEIAELPDFDSLWDHGRPDATERAFRALLPSAPRSDASYRLELLTQIARAEGLQQRFADAHRTLDGVAVELTEALPRVHVRYLLERGRVLNSSGNPEVAAPLFLEAWERGRSTGEDALAVDAAHMLGIVTSGDDQLAWNERAIDLAAASPDHHANAWLGSLLNNIGWTYHDAGRFEDALTVFQRAVEVRTTDGAAGTLIIARWCVARTLRSLERFEDALALQRALLEDLAQTGARDGYVHEELAENLLALGRGDEARPHCATAHLLLAGDPRLAANEPARLDRLRLLGEW